MVAGMLFGGSRERAQALLLFLSLSNLQTASPRAERENGAWHPWRRAVCPCAELHGLPVGVLIARHVAPRAVQLISLRGRQGPRTPRCSAKIGRASLDNLAALLTGLYAPDRAAGPTRWWRWWRASRHHGISGTGFRLSHRRRSHNDRRARRSSRRRTRRSTARPCSCGWRTHVAGGGTRDI